MKRDPSRFLQLGFLALLILCVALAGYWITENYIYTRAVQEYANTVQEQIEALVDDQSQASEALAAIEAASNDIAASENRINRYRWEGAFVLIVLIGGMTVLTRTLRHDRELRRRQQNFLAAVSHEFKSPLASMQLAAETLVMRAPDPDAKRLGQRILEDCERLLRMVDNLLDTTTIEEGRHPLAARETRLADAINASVESFAERAARHSVEIRQSVPEALTLSIDPNAFDAILNNLIDNALKACIAGDGSEIDVTVEHANGRIELRVTDNGLGFSPEDSTLMFEKFHRLGDELRRKTPGTGLGLYIVKRLAELSGATIRASSDGPGRGAEIALSWAEGGSA